MNSAIGYKGEVTIKVKNKSPIIVKNNGTANLFTALIKAMALPRNSTAQYCNDVRDSMPTYAQVYCFESNWDGSLSQTSSYQLLNDIPIIRAVISELGGGIPCIQYSFYLTKSNLWGTVSHTAETYASILQNYSYLVLLNKLKQPLAYVKIDLSNDTEGLNITDWEAAQQAAITWELSFTNVTEPTPQQGDDE